MTQLKLFTLLALLLATTAQATVVDKNYLVRNGDTLSLLAYPLNQYFRLAEVKNDSLRYHELTKSISCGSGNIAYWELSGNRLFLTQLLGCEKAGKQFPVDLKTSFPDRFIDGKVRADWVNGELMISVGEMLRWLEVPSHSIYEREIILTMQNGVLMKEEQFDNSKTYQSKFTKDSRTLPAYLYSHINWSKIPDLGDRKVKVFLTITAGENPHDFSVNFMKKSYYYSLDQEAMRVVKSLPEWDVYYRRGEVYPLPWFIPITFDEATRKQYAR